MGGIGTQGPGKYDVAGNLLNKGKGVIISKKFADRKPDLTPGP